MVCYLNAHALGEVHADVLFNVKDEIEYPRREHEAKEMQQLVVYWESTREVGKPKNAQYDQHDAGQEEEPLKNETRFNSLFR